MKIINLVNPILAENRANTEISTGENDKKNRGTYFDLCKIIYKEKLAETLETLG